ncbi:HEAT repeat domain-containing protein [Nocardioides sp.]|uniref:HEAT repeat domain-containing protein n=1 Tax=Nocardioides sp. TaxID=35761 RepID=UPI002ED209DF
MGDRPVGELIEELAARLGRPEFTRVCVALMEGAPREDHLEALPGLTGHDWSEGEPVRDEQSWHDYWLRTWGARGLLHVWDDAATGAVVAGLSDEHWRPAEMCLKVTARHEVAGAGDGAAALADHELPRVRAAAMRALAVAGDTEHVDVVADAVDDPDPAVRKAAARALEQLRQRLDIS